MAPDEHNMLPNTPGPKLREFKDGKFESFEFLENGGMGSGNHSHVWKTKIDGTVYALKMFRNIGAEEENSYTEGMLQRFNVDKQLVDGQLSPFNCEARAYGRLQETGNEDLAWKCLGWIALDEETYGKGVWDVVGLPKYAWFSAICNSDEEVAGRPVFPIYALVKELIPAEKVQDAPRIDVDKAHEMAVAINTLHRIGITHRDIQDRNYVDCRFMDFSTSWTVPNIRLDRQLKWDFESRIDENDTNDYFMFDRMWEQWNNAHPAKKYSNRLTIEDTKRWERIPPSQRSASQSSQEEVLIPTLERFTDKSFIFLASSYDWQTGTHPGPLEPRVRDPTPVPDPKGASDGGAAPGLPAVDHRHGVGAAAVASTQSTSLPSRNAYRGPDPKLPRLTMLWSWSAHPPAPRYNVNGSQNGVNVTLHGGLNAQKVNKIRRYAAEVIRESRSLNTSGASINPLVSRAQRIIRIIDNSNGGSQNDLNGNDPDELFLDDSVGHFADDDDDDGVVDDEDYVANVREQKRPRHR